MPDKLLSLEGITKVFPGVIANDNVYFDLEKGEIHALVGENGAGKSTLMKILYGMYKPDSGVIKVKGKVVNLRGPLNAISCGIGMVHQHFMLVPHLTALENIILGAEPSKGFNVVDLDSARKKIEQLMEENDMEIPLDYPIEKLSVGLQQRVEILKLLYRGAEIVILDEPTAVLTPQETKELFVSLTELKERGRGIIFISHKLDEVLEIADRITVIRRGKIIKTLKREEANKKILAELMVGRPVLFDLKKPKRPIGDVVFEIKDLYVKGWGNVDAVRGVNLSVREGEIVGIAGVEGNGQAELIAAICGLAPVREGKILLRGKDISSWSVLRRRDEGISHIPQDRQRFGLLLPYPVYENEVLGRMHKPLFSGWLGFLKRKNMRQLSKRLIMEFDIRTPSETVPVHALSGGNQQKVVVARELQTTPLFLIAAYPTRGVDIGAMELIYQKILDAKANGTAILLISADLDEIFSLSDRIAVIYNGRILKEFAIDEATPQDVGFYMMGGKSA